MQNNQSQQASSWFMMVTVMLTLGVFALSLPLALAQSPQRFRTLPELDLSDGVPTTSHKTTASASGRPTTKPFVVKETYHQQGNAPANSHGVVGLDMAIRPDSYPVIQSVFPGTPAQQQGIRPRDLLVAINGVRTYNKSVTEVDALISDVPGDVVSLTVLRGTQLKQIHLTVASVESLSRETQSTFSYLMPEP